jgi:DNA-binding response OmpR family regulator
VRDLPLLRGKIQLTIRIDMPSAGMQSYPRGDESVLLVEPDAETRVLGVFMLDRLGYRVADARNAPDAVRIFDEQDSAFDLLLVEAVMGRVNGNDLAETLRQRHSGLRTLFLADEKYERLARRVAARKGMRFLCRPFTIASLAAAVRTALDTGKRSALVAGMRA